jgi:inorganic pyrophosphatase
MSDEAFAQWRPHPWHGLDVGLAPPQRVNAYIEITPFDVVKYEVHKQTGYTVVDRPQRSSSSPPTLYGFIPRTYCAERVKALSPESHVGDGGEADDKIIAILEDDPLWGDREDLTDLPAGLTGRLEHYFLSYKIMPGERSSVSIPTVYGREHAEAVIDAAIEDYQHAFGASMP